MEVLETVGEGVMGGMCGFERAFLVWAIACRYPFSYIHLSGIWICDPGLHRNDGFLPAKSYVDSIKSLVSRSF